MIQRRELPNWFGSSPIVPCTLVASTTESRRPPASALPTISSDSPREYTSAVSMKLMPASSARWMIASESSWSVLPHAPNIIAPRHSGLTLTPVAPSLRCSITVAYLRSRWARSCQRLSEHGGLGGSDLIEASNRGAVRGAAGDLRILGGLAQDR